MRGLFGRRFAVLLLVLSTVMPASAAPRRDGDYPSIIERIVKLVKHIVMPAEDIKVTIPTP
jgi:hypothetical protein